MTDAGFDHRLCLSDLFKCHSHFSWGIYNICEIMRIEKQNRAGD